MTTPEGAEVLTGSGAMEPSSTVGYGTTATAPGQRAGLLSMLAQYGNRLRQMQQTGGTATTNDPQKSMNAGTPAQTSIGWLNTAPDAMAEADRNRRELGQYAQLAQDVGTAARMAASYGMGGGGMGGMMSMFGGGGGGGGI